MIIAQRPRVRGIIRTSCSLAMLISVLSVGYPRDWNADSASTDVRMVFDEVDAVLRILEAKQAGSTIPDGAWDTLFHSEGYVRLKKRELAMRRPFTDSSFRSFVLSDSLSRMASTLRQTADGWREMDISEATRRALAYLPAGTRIRATMYPVIKPWKNSFVFETDSNPAIFIYLNPKETARQLENTLAHELHHIGYASGCVTQSADSLAPSPVHTVLDWAGAFGEGIAMLAAAGGPGIHPHAESPPEDRARWDHDMKNYNADLKRVEKFFLSILDGRMSAGQIRDTGYAFFGIQGPWYTVGWKMAVTIERRFGRDRLIECICDTRDFFSTYNAAAEENNRSGAPPLALWSADFLRRIAR